MHVLSAPLMSQQLTMAADQKAPFYCTLKSFCEGSVLMRLEN